MSGFVGILRTDGMPVSRDVVGSLTRSLEFRGPDGTDFRIDGPVGLGHTLLRVGAAHPRERQPATLDGSTWVVGDIRIDAQADLIDALRGCFPHGAERCDRRRARAARLRRMGGGVPRAPARGLRLRDLGLAPRASVLRPRPDGREALLLCAVAEPDRVRKHDRLPSTPSRGFGRFERAGNRRLPAIRVQPRRRQFHLRAHQVPSARAYARRGAWRSATAPILDAADRRARVLQALRRLCRPVSGASDNRRMRSIANRPGGGVHERRPRLDLACGRGARAVARRGQRIGVHLRIRSPDPRRRASLRRHGRRASAHPDPFLGRR